MNWFNILEEIERIDPEVYERLDTRRKAMSGFGSFGKKVAFAALPLALSSMFKKAYGQSQADINAVLNFALKLEHLEADFYTAAVGAAGVLGLTGDALAAITTIKNHEVAHVNLLTTTLGAAAEPKPSIDLTGGGGSMAGPFAAALTDMNVFLMAAQAFEDTGVRAYKGQAPALMSDNAVLTTALRIHSVEARHAAHIRYMRKVAGASVDPWITLNQSGIDLGNATLNAVVAMVYAGDEKTMQGPAGNQIDVPAVSGKSATAVSETFDEPLTKEQVLAITGTPGAGMGAANARFFY